MSQVFTRTLRAFSVITRYSSLSLFTRPTAINSVKIRTQLKPTTFYRSMASAASEGIVNLTIDEVLKDGTNGVPVIDVREQVEIHNTGLIPGSVNIPLGHLEEAMGMSPEDFENRFSLKKPEKEDKIIMSCQSGNRSKRAILALQKLGFTNVVNNSEGWKGYEEYTKKA